MKKKELREKIEFFLSRKDKVGMHSVGRALVHLRNRQTEEELLVEETRVHNGRGFQPVHAKIGTSMANFYEKNGFLSPKQVNYWQSGTEKVQKPRIARYSRQLMEEAEKKMGIKTLPPKEEIVEGFDDDQLERMGVKQ